MKTINKKIWPKFFNDVLFNNKRFELREDEDDARPGDVLVLHEWDPQTCSYTGRSMSCTITYVLRPEDAPGGLEEGYCIIGFARWD